MPVVKLGGRLGNQLFQAAFGLAQSLASRQSLLFDWEGIPEDQLGFLEDWVGALAPAPLETVTRLKGKAGLAGKLYRILQRLLPFRYRSWILQDRAAFRRANLNPRSMCYFDGYWQSYQYFHSAAQTVRDSFFYRRPLPPDLHGLIAHMGRGETVSVHVRRGDYVGSGVFSVVPETYYTQAIDRLGREVDIDQIFVFSDDPTWCQHHLVLGRPFFAVEGNTPPVDLLLMSSCKHHVIGPSTFSWWGAWLGQGVGGKVVAPRTWFASYGEVPPLADIYPPEWILI